MKLLPKMRVPKNFFLFVTDDDDDGMWEHTFIRVETEGGGQIFTLSGDRRVEGGADVSMCPPCSPS